MLLVTSCDLEFCQVSEALSVRLKQDLQHEAGPSMFRCNVSWPSIVYILLTPIIKTY